MRWLVMVAALAIAGCGQGDGVSVSVQKTYLANPGSGDWKAMHVVLRVDNQHATKLHHYRGWRWNGEKGEKSNSANEAYIKDEHGNKYEQIGVKDKRVPAGADTVDILSPESGFNEVLLFDPPLPVSKRLTLYLPGRAIEIDRDIVLDVPLPQ